MSYKRIRHFLVVPEVRISGLLFFINALIFSNYAIRLPDIKVMLGINDAQLGLALLFSPLGVVIFSPVAMILMNKFGAGIMSVWTVLGTSLSIVLLAIPTSYTVWCVALFFYGLFHGGLDISMNGLVSALEKKNQRIYMSTAHGFWSLGAMAGAFIGSGVAAFGVLYQWHFVGTSIICLGLLAFNFRPIWGIKDEREENLSFKWPGRNLLIFIWIIFVSFMAEGAIIEWNAIFYNDVLNAPAQWVGLGFAGFTATMALTRFFGDRLIERFSYHQLLLGAILTVVIGIVVFGLGLNIWVCFVAMLVSGAGCSVIVPSVFYQAGNLKKIPPSVALTMVSTFGYAGLLVGPPLMGFISEGFSLNVSFYSLAGLYLLALLLSRFIIVEK
jgi:MFS family permease